MAWLGALLPQTRRGARVEEKKFFAALQGMWGREEGEISRSGRGGRRSFRRFYGRLRDRSRSGQSFQGRPPQLPRNRPQELGFAAVRVFHRNDTAPHDGPRLF